jgi:hypothetical protein
MCSLKRLGVRDYWAAGLALALTPVIFINSTNSMDYLWALAFLLASHHAALIRRPVLAGVLLGLAIGCRLSSSVFILPFLIVLGGPRADRHDSRGRIAFLISACAAAAIAYVPVVHAYGLGFLSFSAPASYPSLIEVVSRASLRIWGLIGSAAILVALAYSLPRRSDRASGTTLDGARDWRVIFAAVAAVCLVLLLYLWLPLEEGYLIPAVPFVILLLACALRRTAFRLVCVGLCLSPFVFGIGRESSASAQTYSSHALHLGDAGRGLVVDPLRGPVLRDYAERLHGMAFVERVLAHAPLLPEDSVIVVGYWLPQIQSRIGSETDLAGRFVYLLDMESLSRHQAAGAAVYFLPEMAAFNRDVYGVDLGRRGATPLDLYWGR